MTIIAIVASLLVASLGAVHVAWAVAHLREDKTTSFRPRARVRA